MASNNSGEGAETVEIAELNAVKSITNDEEIVEKGYFDTGPLWIPAFSN